LIPTIRRTHARNGVSATVLNAVVLPEKTAETVPFYVHEHFSTSSLVEPADGYERIVDVPVVSFEELAREFRPTFLMIDIEGAEIDLFSGLDMAGINKVLIELHKEATGLAGIRQVFGFFAEAGFGYDPDHSSGNVVLFRRPA